MTGPAALRPMSLTTPAEWVQLRPGVTCTASRGESLWPIITLISVIMTIGVARAVWWVWRVVSLELTDVYAEGFRNAAMPEE